jgi:hypothetical protein
VSECRLACCFSLIQDCAVPSDALRRAWSEQVAPDDYETHMAAIGQAEANAGLIRSLIVTHPMFDGAQLLFAGAGTGQMFDYVSPDFLTSYRVTFTDIREEFLRRIEMRLADSEGYRFVVDDVENSQMHDVDAAAFVLVLEHVHWRKAIQHLINCGVQCLYIIVQVNPPGLENAVSPNRVLPPSMAAVPPEAKPELVDSAELTTFLTNRNYRLVESIDVPVPDGKLMRGLVYESLVLPGQRQE